MNLYDFLILTYPARRIAWCLLKKRRRERWNEELLDFAFYSLRTMLLQLLHKQIPELSVTDVMCLSYPLHRLFDVFLRKRRKSPWKAEVKAVIRNWISYIFVEIYILKVLLGVLSIARGGSMDLGVVIEPFWWMIFVFFALRLRKIFMIMIPLPLFVFDDEFMIQPLCASIAEYYPLYVAHPVLSSVYSDVLGIITRLVGFQAMNLYDFLILTYPARRIAWCLLIERLPVNWNEELLDFASYSLRTMLLQLLHKQIPELSVTDVMCLSYPLGRLFDVFLRKRRMFPWKMEVKAVICSWLCHFFMEVYVSKVPFGLENPTIEVSLLIIFMVFAMRLQLAMLLRMDPLPTFVYMNEFLIQPLFASIAEYYPLYVVFSS